MTFTEPSQSVASVSVRVPSPVSTTRHEEVPALALDRVKDVGMPTGCPPLADRVDSDGDVDVVHLKANRLISPPFEAALTYVWAYSR